MRRETLHTVVRVRGLAERRRLAEQAAARRAVLAADADRVRAGAAFAAAVPDVGRADAAALSLHHTGAIALGEAVEHADAARAEAQQSLAAAEQRTVAAAVERRSAERLQQRRQAADDRAAARLEQRRADEIGLQAWRRAS